MPPVRNRDQFDKDYPKIEFTEGETVQLVLDDFLAEKFQEILRYKGLYLFQVPTSEDDLPTYSVGVSKQVLDATPKGPEK